MASLAGSVQALCWHTGRVCVTPVVCAQRCQRDLPALDKKAVIRQTVDRFADEMFAKLMKHINKTTWRDQPVEALLRLLMLEIEEFKVADEFFSVAEARKELIDISNFALILYDRLGMIDQEQNRHTKK